MKTDEKPQSWREAFASLLSSTGLLLMIIFLGFLFTDQFLTDTLQDELLNPQGASNWIWVYGGVSFVLGLIAPLLMSFLVLCIWRFPGRALPEIAGQKLGSLVREEMRVLGKSLAWGLLLVVPGIVRFFLCAFVPYVVMLDSKYQQGEVDALKRSTVFVKKTWGRLLALFVVFGVVIPLLMTSFDPWRSWTLSPFTALPLALVELTFFVSFHWFILKSWEKASAP